MIEKNIVQGGGNNDRKEYTIVQGGCNDDSKRYIPKSPGGCHAEN
jgi:hypothetical protein